MCIRDRATPGRVSLFPLLLTNKGCSTMPLSILLDFRYDFIIFAVSGDTGTRRILLPLPVILTVALALIITSPTFRLIISLTLVPYRKAKPAWQGHGFLPLYGHSVPQEAS